MTKIDRANTIAIHPYGDTSKVKILAKTADAFTEEKVKKAVSAAGGDYEFKSFKKL